MTFYDKSKLVDIKFSNKISLWILLAAPFLVILGVFSEVNEDISLVSGEKYLLNFFIIEFLFFMFLYFSFRRKYWRQAFIKKYGMTVKAQIVEIKKTKHYLNGEVDFNITVEVFGEKTVVKGYSGDSFFVRNTESEIFNKKEGEETTLIVNPENYQEYILFDEKV